jgi:hypothetical protein
VPAKAYWIATGLALVAVVFAVPAIAIPVLFLRTALDLLLAAPSMPPGAPIRLALPRAAWIVVGLAACLWLLRSGSARQAVPRGVLLSALLAPVVLIGRGSNSGESRALAILATSPGVGCLCAYLWFRGASSARQVQRRACHTIAWLALPSMLVGALFAIALMVEPIMGPAKGAPPGIAELVVDSEATVGGVTAGLAVTAIGGVTAALALWRRRVLGRRED